MARRVKKTVCIGLDVHKNNVWCCVCIADPADKGNCKFHTRKFDSNHTDLTSMYIWCREVAATFIPESAEIPLHVYMESTGKYSTPVYNVAEEQNMLPHIVNPAHVKMISGQKTDQKDCAWIAELGANGLLRESYIPDKVIRKGRSLSRARTKLVQIRGDVERRIQNILTESNVRMDLIFSSVSGESAQRVIEYLIQADNPTLEQIKNRIHRTCKIMRYKSDEERKEKEEKLLKAFKGANFSSANKFELREALAQIHQTNQHIRHYEDMMQENFKDYKEILDLLETVPGISHLSALQILSEIGVDMDKFEDAAHFVSWCGLCPASNQSNNKHKSVKIGKGGYYLKPVLVQCALNAKKHPYFATKFESIAARRGKKRALIAICRKMMICVYNMIKKMEPFQEGRLSKTAKKENTGKQSETSEVLNKAIIKQIKSKEALDKGTIEVLKILLEKEGYLTVSFKEPPIVMRN